LQARRLIVSLTSIPPRFGGLGARLEELLAQRPDALCLTIPNQYARFPDWEGALPFLPSGVTLLRGPDHGPASKLVAAAAAFPDADLLICDDDCSYGAGWLAAFRASRAAHPNAAIAASQFDAARIGLPSGRAIVQGFAGVLIRSDWLLPRPPAPLTYVDDIWISASLAARGIQIIASDQARQEVAPHPAPEALQNAQIAGQSRAALNRLAARHFADAFR
jgi:hypothetical protein